jgi:hypothetical protein
MMWTRQRALPGQTALVPVLTCRMPAEIAAEGSLMKGQWERDARDALHYCDDRE